MKHQVEKFWLLKATIIYKDKIPKTPGLKYGIPS